MNRATTDPDIDRLFATREAAPASVRRLDRAWRLLAGPAERFDRRAQVLNAFCGICVGATVALIATNQLQGLASEMQVFSVATLVAFGLLLAIGRGRVLSYGAHATLTVAVTCGVVTAYWLNFGGAAGAAPPLLFGLLWLPLLARRLWLQAALVAGLASLAAVLFATQALMPWQIDAWYQNEAQRMGDIAVATVVCLVMGSGVVLALGRAYEDAIGQIQRERARSESLLRMMMPEDTIARLKLNPRLPVAERHDDATVLFADIAGFTRLAGRVEPEELLTFLHDLFGQFDVVCEEEGLEKVKTIGDSYMAVAGVPREVSDHAVRAARAALRMRDLAAEAFVARSKGLGPYELGIRIGLHSGPLVSGVLNRSKVAFDLWGDTVNIASRMESQGLINEIQLTGATLERLQPEFGTQSRGDMEVRGIGRMQTWLLEPGAVVVPAPTSSRVPEVPGPSTG
jgi:class 3 adenylate cyclase